jgi:GTP cyclohydrolase II
VEAYERLGVPFDTRNYEHCARFLVENNIEYVRLMSNNPRKRDALSAAGITVIPVPLVTGVTKDNADYLRTKRDKAGHNFPADLQPDPR